MRLYNQEKPLLTTEGYLMSTNYSFQKIYNQFQAHNAGILFINIAVKRIEMAMHLAEKYLNKIDYVVWIAPANFLNTLIYTNEIKKNAQTFKHRIKYFAAESISVSDSKYLDLYNLITNHKTFCIVDESLTFKNYTSHRTQRLLFLSQFFQYKLILSSIPVSRGLIDFYSQLEFLDRKILKMNKQQFYNIFMPDFYPNYMVMKQWSRQQDENKLMDLISPYILGYDINDKYVINHYNHYFDLTPREQISYQQEKFAYLQKKSRLVFMDLVQNFQRMYTISQNKLFGLQKTVTDICNRKEKAIVYIKFLDELAVIKESKILSDIPFIELSKKTNKRKAIKDFERNVDIMFCTYGVEKFGLDMQICNNMIYYSQTFDYRYKIQSLDSVVFKGFPSYINIYDFWVKTNLEHLIKDSLKHKKNLVSNIYKTITASEALQL